MAKPGYENPPLAPMVILVGLATCACIFTFWIGTVCIRLWFYNGTLGPEGIKYIIIPKHRKEQVPKLKTPIDHRMTILPQVHLVDKRATTFPHLGQESIHTDPFADNAFPAPNHSNSAPTITINSTNDNPFNDPPDHHIHTILHEERRISRLPAFEQDDCGDGSQFPSIPFASRSSTTSHEAHAPASALQQTGTYLALGLQTVPPNSWLTIDNTYIEQWEARMSLLRDRESECVYFTRDGEDACVELLGLVTHLLGVKYPEYFSSKSKYGTRYIRCDFTGEEYAVEKPMEYKPLEVCARVCAEDLNVFVRDEFTLGWYLQASVACFPSGYRVSKYIGKSLKAIINDILDPMVMWEDLPQILDLIQSTPKQTFTKTSTFIQTRPRSTPLTSTLHIPRPMDFFAGTSHDLHPYSLIIRREIQTFKVLPRTGAIVMAIKTELKGLSELNELGKRELMEEIEGWDSEEAIFKGRDLWIRAVKGWCSGGSWVKDDKSVVDAGALTRIGD